MKNIRVIETYNDPGFSNIEVDFYNNFIPDDWSYIMVSERPNMRKSTIEKAIRATHPRACDFQFAKVAGRWMAVSYHS
jgi:hypothetical protein